MKLVEGFVTIFWERNDISNDLNDDSGVFDLMILLDSVDKKPQTNQGNYYKGFEENGYANKQTLFSSKKPQAPVSNSK